MRRVIGRIRGFFNYLSGICSDIFYCSSAGLSASLRKEPSLDDEGYDGAGIERDVDREKAAILEEIASLRPDFSRNPRDFCDDERKPAKRVILIDDAFVEDALSNFIQIL